MEIKIFVNNPWQENTVVLYDRTGEAVIIDCGCFSGEEERRLQDFLSQKKLKPVALLDTHLHIDHIFGNNFIKNTYGLSAQASNEDNFLVENAVEYAAMLGVTGITPPPAVGKFLKDGDRVRFGNARVLIEGIRRKLLCLPDEVKVIPGHGPATTIGEEKRYNPFLN